MNDKDIAKQILLAESGELGLHEQRTLEQVLANDAELSQYRDEVRATVRIAQDALPGGEPSEAVMSAIRDAADAQRPGPVVFQFSRPAVHWLAAAATFLLVVGVWQFHPRETQADRVQEMHALLSIAALPEHSHMVESTVPGEDEENLRELGQLILLMEGLATEESFMDSIYEDEVSPLSDPVPTALQPHSTRESQAERYG